MLCPLDISLRKEKKANRSPYWICREFPKADRIGYSFLVLLGYPSRRHDLGTEAVLCSLTGKYYVHLIDFLAGCDASLGMESRKIRDKQIKVSTYSTGIHMRARNARLNSNGGWCVKTLENYETKEENYHIPSEFLGRCKCQRYAILEYH